MKWIAFGYKLPAMLAGLLLLYIAPLMKNSQSRTTELPSLPIQVLGRSFAVNGFSNINKQELPFIVYSSSYEEWSEQDNKTAIITDRTVRCIFCCKQFLEDQYPPYHLVTHLFYCVRLSPWSSYMEMMSSKIEHSVLYSSNCFKFLSTLDYAGKVTFKKLIITNCRSLQHGN